MLRNQQNATSKHRATNTIAATALIAPTAPADMPCFRGDGKIVGVFVVEEEDAEVVIVEEEDADTTDPEMKKRADSAIWLRPVLIGARVS